MSPCARGYTVTSSTGLALDDHYASKAEGNLVWLHEANGSAAQAWTLADPALPRTVDDGAYRLATSLDGRMAVSASASGCSLSRGGAAALAFC